MKFVNNTSRIKKGYTMKTILTNDLLELAFEVGKLRNDSCKKVGIYSNKKSKKRSNFWIDYNGAAGEIAFAKMMFESSILSEKEYNHFLENIKNNDIKPASLGLDDGDIRIGKFNIDVKTSEYRSAHLWLTSNKKGTNLIDYYALLIGNVDNTKKDNLSQSYVEFELKGFMSHNDAIKNWNKTCSGISGKFHQSELIDNIF
jgi:hypothetical protein